MGSLLRYCSVVVLVLLWTSNVRAVSVGKSVNVSVRAKWEGTSLLLEAGLVIPPPTDSHASLYRQPIAVTVTAIKNSLKSKLVTKILNRKRVLLTFRFDRVI